MAIKSGYFYSLHRHFDGHAWPARQFSDKHTALHALSSEAGEQLQFTEPGARSGSFTLKCLVDQRGRAGELLEEIRAIDIDAYKSSFRSLFFTSEPRRAVVVEKVKRRS